MTAMHTSKVPKVTMKQLILHLRSPRLLATPTSLSYA
jgi:hypothetical protein